jgi:hypothetical protein
MASVKRALPLEHGRHGGDHRSRDGLPLALVVQEEERAIAANRAAEHATELLAPEFRLDGTAGREVVAGIERFMAAKRERGAAKPIGA